MTRTVDIRYQVLRGGASLTELKALDSSAPVLRMDDSGAIKTALSGTFRPNAEVDWMTDEIQPVLIVDGTEHPLGVFIPTTADEETDDDAPRVVVEAYDRCWRVQDTKSESRVSLLAGTNYIAAVEQLLVAAGIGLVQKTATTATLTETREDWEIGTDSLSIANELLSEINYAPLHFTADGVAVLEPVRKAGADTIQHTLDSSNVRSLLLPTFRRSLDVYTAPNVFLCVCNNPDKSGQMIAPAENTNPLSALSINRRGRRIVKTVKLNNIADQSALQAYADRLRDESMGVHETIRVSTALLPGWGVGDVTALRYDDYSGICTEHAWTMTLQPGGTMTHTLERVIFDI